MPFSSGDATRFKRDVNSDGQKERWARIANSVLKRTGDEGRAIRAANANSKSSSNKSVSRRLKKVGHP